MRRGVSGLRRMQFQPWAYVNDLGTYEDCIYPGCMDLLALNYDAEAGCEISYSGEQFCIMQIGLVPGCTNSFASNYDPNATVDNGSCDMSFLCGPGTFFDEASGSCLVVEGGKRPRVPPIWTATVRLATAICLTSSATLAPLATSNLSSDDHQSAIATRGLAFRRAFFCVQSWDSAVHQSMKSIEI